MSQLKNTAIENLTPEQLALLSEKLNKLSGIKKKKEQIEKRKNIEEYPMSSAQKRLWFLHQLDPQSSNYNIFSALCLKGEFDLYALEYSLNQIIKRHEVLRSVYSTKGNEPVQIILPSIEIKLPLTDISELDETAKQKRLQEILQTEANKPFNLSEGPLLRSEIIRLNENEHVLMLTMHHIIADGWSFNILISEIAALYKSNIFNTKTSLEELKIQYSDFAQWQNERLETKAFDAQLSYWKDKLSNMPNTLELPFYKKAASLRSNLGERNIFFVSQKMRNLIERISKGESATLFMALLSVFQIMLYKISRQDDFGIGIPIANRNRPEIEKLIGFFVNTLVIRVKDIENLTFRELLGKLRDYMTEAFDNQDIPFDKVVEALMPKREINTTPLFQVMFDMQSSYTQSLKFPALQTDIVDFNTQNSKFDLLLMIEDQSDRLKCTFEYNTDLFKESTIRQMISHFQNLIKQVVQSPEKRISDIEILSNEEY
ncbi:MAG: condensation domain-containing protein, partial [Bacteroidota bacterium]|nr:condensation domain-containing protein [Bacteroidota bacterium]MDP4195850.1 condensation domain-containing protein [Bacteroidota bacterium]